MRLCVGLHLEREATLPIDHQYELMSLVYRLLDISAFTPHGKGCL